MSSISNSNSQQQQWQNLIRLRLEERNEHERAHDGLIQDYQRLIRFAKQQRERSASLLAAAGVVKPTAIVATGNNQPTTSAKAAAAASSDNDGVKQAYIQSLEQQLQQMRIEVTTLYKTQSQNAQRLLTLNDEMRVRDDKQRQSDIATQKHTDELTKLQRKESDLLGAIGEKDKMIQLLQDELSAISLELNQVELRNEDLKRDNASLLQRWLDRMNDEATKMNDGNAFLSQVQREQQRRVSDSPASVEPQVLSKE